MDAHRLIYSPRKRTEYLALRNDPGNAKNFYDARGGDERAKASLRQFCYNDLLPDGVLKGCCHPSSTFAHDIDCGDASEQARIRDMLLAKREEAGLLELSGSARYGLHAVCRRERGRTIRECQYRLSMLTQTEYDTNARGLARVLYTGPATEDNLFYLDDAIFSEEMSIEESEREYLALKEREEQGLEDIPEGARKANKHYRPWEEETAEVRRLKAEVKTEDTDTEQEPATLEARKMPQGIRDSIEAVGQPLAMPVVTAICPCIGALATGVRLDVHSKVRGLNLIAYIVGEFASGKGDIDPVVDAWMKEVRALDDMYEQQEDEYRAKYRAAKNQKNQPEEPKLPKRFITLNTTVANLADRLSNTGEKHAFSYTPEADTVAEKWKSSISDFSVMIRQSYDGSRYDREARSAEAVNVHIKHLLWNVTMCGTPDALYRVVRNYTDGLQSRIALAQTPDNTYAQYRTR